MDLFNQKVPGTAWKTKSSWYVVGANQHTARPGWRESGLIEELRLADAVNNPQRCWELWDLLDRHAHAETQAVHQCLARSLLGDEAPAQV